MGEHLRNPPVIFLVPIPKPPLSVPVAGEGKMKDPVLKGRQLSAEIPLPHLIPLVGAHTAQQMQPAHVLLCDFQEYFHLNVLLFFIKIPLRGHIGAAQHADRIQNGRFSCIIFSHQNQGIANFLDLHLPDGFEIPDNDPGKAHSPRLLLTLPSARYKFSII